MEGSGLIRVLLIANGVGLLICVLWLAKLSRRFVNVFANLDSKHNLADTIIDYYAKVGATNAKLDNLQQSYEHLAKISTLAIQKTGIVRFNPFADTGGDQSFVMALLDNHDSGFLLTSIHGREGTRVYIKPVEYGTSQYQLSTEEEAALKVAKNPKANNKEEKDV